MCAINERRYAKYHTLLASVVCDIRFTMYVLRTLRYGLVTMYYASLVHSYSLYRRCHTCILQTICWSLYVIYLLLCSVCYMPNTIYYVPHTLHSTCDILCALHHVRSQDMISTKYCTLLPMYCRLHAMCKLLLATHCMLSTMYDIGYVTCYTL